MHNLGKPDILFTCKYLLATYINPNRDALRISYSLGLLMSQALLLLLFTAKFSTGGKWLKILEIQIYAALGTCLALSAAPLRNVFYYSKIRGLHEETANCRWLKAVTCQGIMIVCPDVLAL